MFNTSNFNEYTVTVRPNTYAGILATGSFASKTNSACSYILGQEWNVSVVCSGYSGTDVKTINSIVRVNNTQVNWNYMNVSGNVFVDNSVGVISNSNFTDVIVSLSNSNVSFYNVSLINSSFVISNDSVVDVFNTSYNISSFSDSDFRAFNYSTISFSNGTELINLSGSYNSSSGDVSFFDSVSSIFGFFLVANESDSISYSFNPILNFMYFPNTTILSDFTSDKEIVYVPTGLPQWNYSLNVSHQTDFRNYTLLQNITNITDINLSLSRTNVTLLTYENYSFLNLLEGFSEISTGFNLSLPGRYFVSHFVGDLTNPLVLKDSVISSDLEVVGGIAGGEVTSGVYSVVENVTFDVDIPFLTPDVSFDISVNYLDYFNVTDFSSSCSLFIDSVEHSFTNITLSSGVYEYTVSCSSLEVVDKEQSGSLLLSSVLFWDIEQEIAGFYSSEENYFFFYSILSSESIFSRGRFLNDSFDYFSLHNFNTFDSDLDEELFYFNGKINNQELQITN